MEEKNKSKVEIIKESSHYLRGTIDESLKQDTNLFESDDTQLLKFFGIYQQDDRDTRLQRIKDKKEKDYSLMIRSKFPGGVLSPDQYLMFDDICERLSNNTLRVTTRQTLQLHGVLKKNLKEAIQTINTKLITTLGACGDVVRNVMATPIPQNSSEKARIIEFAQTISDDYLPLTSAYSEIFLNGEKISEISSDNPEPFYGKAYMPRKFKIGIAFPEDNSIDIYTQDLGIVPSIQDGVLKNFTILVGGGLGFTHRKEATYPRLASELCIVGPDELHAVAKAIISVQRDYGGRKDRKHARLKYLIDDWGLEKFKKEVERVYGKSLTPVAKLTWADSSRKAYYGFHALEGEHGYYGLFIENGRIKDEGPFRLKEAIKEIVMRLKPELRLTPYQDILFCNITKEGADEIEVILKEHGVKIPDETSLVRKSSMACVSLPTCGLALGESERALPKLLDIIEKKLHELGLGENEISFRMTGCPNSCARPETAEVAFIATQPDTYNVYIGGGFFGERMNTLYKERVPFSEIIDVLTPLFEDYKSQKKEDEYFGDFCYRTYIKK